MPEKLYPSFSPCAEQLSEAASHEYEVKPLCKLLPFAFIQEINELQALSMPEHLNSSRIAQAMKTRYPVSLCTYSHEVLMHFLQGSRLYLVLGIINDHLKIKVCAH